MEIDLTDEGRAKLASMGYDVAAIERGEMPEPKPGQVVEIFPPNRKPIDIIVIDHDPEGVPVNRRVHMGRIADAVGHAGYLVRSIIIFNAQTGLTSTHRNDEAVPE
jgi:hypothetical protein